MEQKTQSVKSGATGTLRHPYRAPAVETSKFKTLVHLTLVLLAVLLGLALTGFGGK